MTVEAFARAAPRAPAAALVGLHRSSIQSHVVDIEHVLWPSSSPCVSKMRVELGGIELPFAGVEVTPCKLSDRQIRCEPISWPAACQCPCSSRASGSVLPRVVVDAHQRRLLLPRFLHRSSTRGTAYRRASSNSAPIRDLGDCSVIRQSPPEADFHFKRRQFGGLTNFDRRRPETCSRASSSSLGAITEPWL